MPALVTTRASPSGSLSLVSTLPWIGFGAVSSVTEAESGLASGAPSVSVTLKYEIEAMALRPDTVKTASAPSGGAALAEYLTRTTRSRPEPARGDGSRRRRS